MNFWLRRSCPRQDRDPKIISALATGEQRARPIWIMTIVARTDSAQSAKNLGETVEGLRQLGGMFIGRMPQPRKTLAQTALDNLKVTARGNELEIRTQVAAANLAALIK